MSYLARSFRIPQSNKTNQSCKNLVLCESMPEKYFININNKAKSKRINLI